MNATPHFENNEFFNPLFAKMKERFCADGTIAEKMAIEAGLVKKRRKKGVAKKSADTRSSLGSMHLSDLKESVFNWKNVGIASMSALLLGVVLFSGASFGKIHESFAAKTQTNTFRAAEILTEEDNEFGADMLCVANENTPDTI